MAQRRKFSAEYKWNDGHATIDGDRVNDWNASAFGFLFGAKMFF